MNNCRIFWKLALLQQSDRKPRLSLRLDTFHIAALTLDSHPNFLLPIPRLPSQQHCEVPDGLHQQGRGELCGGVPGRLLPLPAGLPVLHPELHGPAAGPRGSPSAPGHLRVLLHPRRAHGRTPLRPGHQPQLQGQQCEFSSAAVVLTSDLKKWISYYIFVIYWADLTELAVLQ